MLKRYGTHLLYFCAAIAFFLTFAALYGVFGKGWPAGRLRTTAHEGTVTVKPVIRADTVIRKEIRYLCGDRVSTRIPTTSDLVGLEFAGLVKKYPPAEGWNIDDTEKNALVLARVEGNVCPYHREFRHFGINEGFLAVYEGPLGYNQKVLQREDIPLAGLPPEMQADLTMTMDYDNQPPDTQGKLKSAFEFESEAQLNAALENFDEFRE